MDNQTKDELSKGSPDVRGILEASPFESQKSISGRLTTKIYFEELLEGKDEQ